jgi:hypothetical protein
MAGHPLDVFVPLFLEHSQSAQTTERVFEEDDYEIGNRREEARYRQVAGRLPSITCRSAGEGYTRDVIKDDFGGKLPSGRPFRLDVRERRPDVCLRPHLHRGRSPASARTWASARTHLPPLPLSLPPLPSPFSLPPLCCPHGHEKNQKKIHFIFIKNFFGSCCRLEREKKFTIYNFRFSVFNPRSPQNPRNPQAPWAARAKP